MKLLKGCCEGARQEAGEQCGNVSERGEDVTVLKAIVSMMINIVIFSFVISLFFTLTVLHKNTLSAIFILSLHQMY